jgi:zinc protease
MPRFWITAAVTLAALTAPLNSFAAEVAAVPPSTPGSAPSVQNIDFTAETLPNGLKVIYAPLHQAPVVQVRVLYHVGSRDERSDRQGFAHMFEHMMFRGSRHVAPQEHMRLVDQVGGICNAFTSFDQTVYHDTVPAEDLEMCLYLEADRMSSFKVTDEIYQIERKVVAQEWMLKQNKPYGNLYEDLFKTAFTKSSYQWTPIGNMQQLLAAPAAELQDFFNTYYVPNNAVLVIAGDVDVKAARAMVQKYFAWIPAGAPVHQTSPIEPPQTQSRSVNTPDRLARLTAVVMGYHVPPYKSDDNYALSVLSAILGEGSSSRLDRALVNTADPLCDSAETLFESLENGGMFGVIGEVKPGKDPQEVKKVLTETVADLLSGQVSAEELARAKTQRRVETIHGRETADQIGGAVGDEELWAGDPSRVNSDLAKLDAVTAADVQAVARKYLNPDQVTVLTVQPDPLGKLGRKAAMAAQALFKGAPVVASSQPILARDVSFPADYPEHPPLPPAHTNAAFAKGQDAIVNGVHLIVLTDNRLPIVSWTLAMRRGSHSDPADKAGLASLTDELLMHGAGKYSFQQLSDELAAHGIDLDVADDGDTTRFNGSCTTDELDRAFARSRDVLLSPTLPADEFAKLKDQTIAGLTQSLATPSKAADDQILTTLFGSSPLGHPSTPQTVGNITLEDVKACYANLYHPNDAIMVFSGDITLDRAQKLVADMTDGWKQGNLPAVKYEFPPVPKSRQITLIDTADTAQGAGSVIRMAIKAYSIHDDEKFAGSLAGTLLSAGIESRLMEYVRAQKGYVYGVRGSFEPGRYVGDFSIEAPTRPAVTGDCIKAIFKVLDDLKNPGGDNPLTEQELDAAKRRVAGSMVMSMQTAEAQANKRLDGLLNGYPIDYYDVYPQRINAVTVDQVRAVVSKYVIDDSMSIVVAAPAAVVKPQLDQLGQVTVIPMPLAREQGKSTDLLK